MKLIYLMIGRCLMIPAFIVWAKKEGVVLTEWYRLLLMCCFIDDVYSIRKQKIY